MIRMLIGAIVGGAVGAGLWYLGRCTSGACPLTSNPVLTVTMGALVGAMLAAKR